MRSKILWFLAMCIIQFLGIESAFIKGKNVPRVGRSNEADGFFDHEMGYVIKTMPSKNIPRMGRRNYDSENRYNIPKYGLPFELLEEGQEEYEPYLSRFEEQMDNMNNRN